MKKLYSDLYESFDKNELAKYAHFVSMAGEKFDKEKYKLLIVGRAVNGWGNLDVSSPEAFGEQAQTCFEETGFKWINFESESLCNFPKEDENTYYLSKSPF